MKRCPECRRDYYDDSLAYCLDDGAVLLDGPPTVDEPATALITPHVTEPATRTLDSRATDAVQRTRTSPANASRRSSLIAGVVAVVCVALLGIGGYLYYERGSSRQIESIAVMPLLNESGNADLEYLSDGMTETLIKSLSNLPNLSVKPRSSVFRYKGKDVDLKTIGKELNVQAILNGRVAQRGDQLTLSLELVDVQKDRVIWTEQYQRKQSDLVSLQSEIAKDVSTKLTPKLSGAEETKVTKAATTDSEAYQAYLKGRYYWNRRTAENIVRAIEQFKVATDRDPNYALAFVGLADCYAVSSEYAGLPSRETIPRARTYAQSALAIDPSLAEAHTTIGAIEDFDWHWAESEKEFKRSIELNPNYATTYHWYSIFLRNVGRYDESATAIKRASELDPLSSVIAVNVTRVYQVQKDDEASIANSLKIIELDPNFGPAYQYLALSYVAKGKFDEAIANAQKAVELSNRSGISLGDLGYVYAVAGRRQEAISLIRELDEKYTRHEAIGQDLAAILAGLGERDQVFDWLEKDFRARDGRLPSIRWEPQFDSIKNDGRYMDLLKRMSLTE